MYIKLDEYIKTCIDHMFNVWCDKIIFDQDRNEFVFISMIGFNTTSKDIVGAINENASNIGELKGDISELQSIGFYIDEEGYLCQNIKEDM